MRYLFCSEMPVGLCSWIAGGAVRLLSRFFIYRVVVRVTLLREIAVLVRNADFHSMVSPPPFLFFSQS